MTGGIGSGEIDIVEGVNDQSTNRMTLHTNDGCAIATPSPANMTDTVLTKNCNVFAPDQPSNQGCAIQSQSANTYGPAFNINGGGTWAVEVTNQAVSVHFFPAGSVPQDILAGLPKPETWGMPTARFGGNCNIANHFRKLKIVINTTFCGDVSRAPPFLRSPSHQLLTLSLPPCSWFYYILVLPRMPLSSSC